MKNESERGYLKEKSIAVHFKNGTGDLDMVDYGQDFTEDIYSDEEEDEKFEEEKDEEFEDYGLRKSQKLGLQKLLFMEKDLKLEYQEPEEL